MSTLINQYLKILESKSNIVIEELPDSDVKQLDSLMKRFNKDSNAGSYFNYKGEPNDLRHKSIINKKHIILIARDNNKIVGLVVGITRQSPQGAIKMVFVDKPYRGTGLAEKMFSQVVNWLKENNRPVIRLGVMGQNIQAQKFYKKMGFVVDSMSLRNNDSKNIKLDW